MHRLPIFSGNMQIEVNLFFRYFWICCSYFSAFAISKIYKNFNFKFTLIVPVLMMIYFGYENIITSSEVSISFMIKGFVRDIIMLITFYYYLMDYRVSNE